MFLLIYLGQGKQKDNNMSGIKKYSELSLEELIKRMSLICCHKCDRIHIDSAGDHWSCIGCECVCCDSCVEEGDVDNEEIGEDCGFYCNICKEKFLKEKENN